MCSTFFLLTQDFQLPSLFLPAHQILQMEIFEMPWGNDFIAAGLDCVNHCSIAVATSLRRLKSVHVMLCFEAITSMTSTLSYQCSERANYNLSRSRMLLQFGLNEKQKQVQGKNLEIFNMYLWISANKLRHQNKKKTTTVKLSVHFNLLPVVSH